MNVSNKSLCGQRLVNIKPHKRTNGKECGKFFEGFP